MENSSGKPELMKKINLGLLYKALITLKTATRAELAAKTQISATTVRSMLAELIESGDIVELELDESSGGRRAQRYSLNPSCNILLSLYFEDETIHYQVNHLTGTLIKTGKADLDIQDINHSILSFVAECMKKWEICAVGLGVPGIVENGRYYVSSGQNQWVINNIGEQIQNTYHCPVILENDLNAIAIGFAIDYGKSQGLSSLDDTTMAYIHFNLHCSGAGIIVNGNIIHGVKQFAGELGFLPILENKTLDTAMDEAENAQETADIISRTIAIVNCVTNPSLVVIGGVRVEAYPDIKRLVHQKMQNYIASIVQPEIMISHNSVGDYLRGLSYLIMEQLMPLLPLNK